MVHVQKRRFAYIRVLLISKIPVRVPSAASCKGCQNSAPTPSMEIVKRSYLLRCVQRRDRVGRRRVWRHRRGTWVGTKACHGSRLAAATPANAASTRDCSRPQ